MKAVMDKANRHPNPMSSPEVLSKKRRTDDNNVDFSQTAPLPSISSNVPSSSAGKRPVTSSMDESSMNRSK